MTVLGIWSFLAIFYQTCLCVVVSWLTLSCRLAPDSAELAEVTLVKLLYFYDPEACGRIHFYNYTTSDVIAGAGTAILWPVRNEVAAGFRRKMKIWLVLHVIWTILAAVNIGQGNRPCGYYVSLLPFTITGVAILVVDIVFCALFLADVPGTGTEAEILDYINSDSNSLRSINVTLQRPSDAEDTSWIAITLAYSSLRGIVQWVFNFWIVKDTHANGQLMYRHLQHNTHKPRTRGKSMQMYRIQI